MARTALSREALHGTSDCRAQGGGALPSGALEQPMAPADSLFPRPRSQVAVPAGFVDPADAEQEILEAFNSDGRLSMMGTQFGGWTESCPPTFFQKGVADLDITFKGSSMKCTESCAPVLFQKSVHSLDITFEAMPEVQSARVEPTPVLRHAAKRKSHHKASPALDLDAGIPEVGSSLLQGGLEADCQAARLPEEGGKESALQPRLQRDFTFGCPAQPCSPANAAPGNDLLSHTVAELKPHEKLQPGMVLEASTMSLQPGVDGPRVWHELLEVLTVNRLDKCCKVQSLSNKRITVLKLKDDGKLVEAKSSLKAAKANQEILRKLGRNPRGPLPKSESAAA